MCGESHWRAASNKGRKTAKLDETGLEIAGCRHGLAQWAVNMYQGELYGYANYIHVKKMIPAGVTYSGRILFVNTGSGLKRLVVLKVLE